MGKPAEAGHDVAVAHRVVDEGVEGRSEAFLHVRRELLIELHASLLVLEIFRMLEGQVEEDPLDGPQFPVHSGGEAVEAVAPVGLAGRGEEAGEVGRREGRDHLVEARPVGHGHGGVDADGNVWVTDFVSNAEGTKGHQVHKFSPDGELLLRGTVKAACLNADTLRPTRVPASIFEEKKL